MNHNEDAPMRVRKFTTFLFYLSYVVVMPGWICLIAIPDNVIATQISKALGLAVAFFYLISLILGCIYPPSNLKLSYSTIFKLDELQVMMNNLNDIFSAVTWEHILAGDLLLASFMVDDANNAGFSSIYFVTLPVILTLTNGSFGFFVYCIIKGIATGTIY